MTKKKFNLVKNMLMIYSSVVFNSLITRDRVTLSFIQVRINQAWCLILHSDVDSNPTCCNRVVTQESELCHYRWGIFKTFLLGTHFTVNFLSLNPCGFWTLLFAEVSWSSYPLSQSTPTLLFIIKLSVVHLLVYKVSVSTSLEGVLWIMKTPDHKVKP